MLSVDETKIAVTGLGYVGLPLAVEFSEYFDTGGFDISTACVKELAAGKDATLEVSAKELAAAGMLSFEGDVYDPWADPGEVMREYGIDICKDLPVAGQYDGIVIAVSYTEVCAMSADEFRLLGKETCVLYDIRDVLPADQIDGRL